MFKFPLKMKFITKSAITFLASFIGIGGVNAADVEPIKILFIGNSYTHMNDMTGIFEKIAIKAGKNVLVERNTQSGASFKVHSEREDMYEAIKSRKWDYVILQGYSRELSFSPKHIDTASIPYLNKITDSIFANNPCTNLLFYMTWGYESGFPEREEVDSYEKMADSIERGYRYVCDRYRASVVPVGMVWKEVKQKSGIDLYAPDRAHPSINGSYLIASTFYGAIFNETNERIFTSTVKTEVAEVIVNTAKEYLGNNRSKYNLDENRFTLNSYINKKGHYLLDVASTYPKAKSIKWDFGDGNSINSWTGTHKFKKAGRYIVQITIEDECGIRTQERLVEYKKPEKPKRRKRNKPKYNVKNDKKI